jgi:hypothetical protein
VLPIGQDASASTQALLPELTHTQLNQRSSQRRRTDHELEDVTIPERAPLSTARSRRGDRQPTAQRGERPRLRNPARARPPLLRSPARLGAGGDTPGFSREGEPGPRLPARVPTAALDERRKSSGCARALSLSDPAEKADGARTRPVGLATTGDVPYFAAGDSNPRRGPTGMSTAGSAARTSTTSS